MSRSDSFAAVRDYGANLHRGLPWLAQARKPYSKRVQDCPTQSVRLDLVADFADTSLAPAPASHLRVAICDTMFASPATNVVETAVCLRLSARITPTRDQPLRQLKRETFDTSINYAGAPRSLPLSTMLAAAPE
jgi:hypothetical protein